MRCYAFLEEDLSRQIDNPQKNRFLKHLSSPFKQWQVRQADCAIKLYQYFLSQNQKGEDIKKISIKAWQWLEEEATRLLQLKHRAYRTEKTYLGWIRRFGEFLDYKASEGLKGQDLQDFLTYLAVEGKVAPPLRIRP